MTIIGTIESLWRYPVKSMRGEEVAEAFMGFSGFYGDRCYAIKNSAARKGFPYLNANVQPQMLCCQPHFRTPERAVAPPNLAEAMSISPGVTPANPEPSDLAMDVTMPTGEVIALDDPALLEMLGQGLRGENRLSLVHSDRALTDCRPISLISLPTIRQIEEETAFPVDKRRFRANIYVDLETDSGFFEDAMVGRRLKFGASATVMVLERDPRCKMISLDPDTGEHNSEVLRRVSQGHAGFAGLYCAVLIEGILTKSDSICLLD